MAAANDRRKLDQVFIQQYSEMFNYRWPPWRAVGPPGYRRLSLIGRPLGQLDGTEGVVCEVGLLAAELRGHGFTSALRGIDSQRHLILE